MRGHDEQTHHMFSYLSPEQRVPADHPLRAVRALTDHALKTMSRRFAGLYAKTGRPSIPPEQFVAGPVAAGAVHDPERTAADGRAQLQPAVPLVRRLEYGRPGLASHDVYQEFVTGCWRGMSRPPSLMRSRPTPGRPVCEARDQPD